MYSRTILHMVPEKTCREAPQFLYDCNILLIQRRHKKICSQLTLFDFAQLRNILIGAVYTQERKHKANCATDPICPWCDQNKPETIDHLFWSCPAWQHLRATVASEFDVVLPILPPCMKECGLFPKNLLHTEPFTPQYVQNMVPKIQYMMISILRERDSKNQKDPTPQPPISDPITEDPQCEQHQDSDGQSRYSLFPHYPWKYEQEISRSRTFFKGVIPSNWRLYRAGSKWLFGIGTFHPLVWYWTNLQWPEEGSESPGVSWLELALDFYAATHCALAMPDEMQDSRTAAQRAHFFNSASRRMAKICGGSLSPGEYVTHVPVLTSIGMGRASGFSVRPYLMCPAFVHDCLFQTIMECNCHIGQNFKFVPVLPAVPRPLWTAPAVRTRLHGKQPPKPEVQIAVQQRKVKSHKSTVVSITWTPAEKERIEAATDWRQKQQFEKILLHNRTARLQEKHVIGLERINKVYQCTTCHRTNSNLSKLLLDKCGGSNHDDRGSHVPRNSVMLQQRQALIREHNNHRGVQHEFRLPQQYDDALKCIHCGAENAEGWRRFAALAKQVCPCAK